MTNICDFPYPIYDLTKNLIPNLWPDQKLDTQFMTWPLNQYPGADLPYNNIISLVQTNVKGNVYLLLLGRLHDKEVASK